MADPRLDTMRAFTSPEQATYRYRIAGPLVRGIAYVIDFLLMVVLIIAVGLIATLVIAFTGLFSDTDFFTGVMVGVLFIAVFLVLWLVPGWVEFRYRGRTPGKRAMGVRTVTTTGFAPSLGSCMLRTLLRFADSLPTAALGLSVMVMNRDFRRLGDIAAGTMVVYDSDTERVRLSRTSHKDLKALRPAHLASLPDRLLTQLDQHTVAAIASYVERRGVLGSGRREEIASVLADALRPHWSGSRSLTADTMLLICYHHCFMQERQLMTKQVQAVVKRRRPQWKRLYDMGSKFARRKASMHSGDSFRFARMHRAAGADLALLEHATADAGVLDDLRQLVGRSMLGFYPRRRPSWRAINELVLQRVPAALYGDGCVRIATMAFFGVFAIAMLVGALDPSVVSQVTGEEMVTQIQDMYADHPSDREVGDAMLMQGFYINNNVGISLMCFASGILAGIGSLVFLSFNGIFLGLLFGLMVTVEPATRSHFFEFVTAHGPFELTGIMLSGAAGMRLGMGWFATAGHGRMVGLQRGAQQALPIMLVAGTLVALAAPIEAWVSPSSLSLTMKRMVSICCLLLLLWYIVIQGYIAHRRHNFAATGGRDQAGLSRPGGQHAH